MTSLRQIEANRRNSLRSTGPKTNNGKQRASQNAVRHGLTAETVITPLEDPEDYKAFEQAVTADYEAETALERELVLRLASLLWRLRRATSIETGLLKIPSEIHYDPRATPQSDPSHDCGVTVFPLVAPGFDSVANKAGYRIFLLCVIFNSRPTSRRYIDLITNCNITLKLGSFCKRAKATDAGRRVRAFASPNR